MAGELITVGDELLSGRVVNSNAAEIARQLSRAGFELRWITVVGDSEEDITAALVTAMERAAFVLTTGGLGPTEDDRTSTAIARALGRPLCRDPLSWSILSSHIEQVRLPMTPGIGKMADLPEGAQRIDRIRPRAGFYIGDASRPLFCLPGVPAELREMLADFVLTTLQRQFPEQKPLEARALRIFGLRESEVGHRLSGLERTYPGLRVGYLPCFPEIHLTLTVQAATRNAAESILNAAARTVSQRLYPHVYGQGEEALEVVVGRLLSERGHTLAIAESCTGGLIADRISNVPGSSAYFDCAMVTYSEAAKTTHLDVPGEIIARHGVVSAEVAEKMARGIRGRTNATVAVAVTGVAGPTGGTPDNPVGSVYMALLCGEAVRVDRFRFKGSRRDIKTLAAHTALDWLRRAMIDDAFFAERQPGQP
jgi:nicotinamide-nucleotide amidase